MSELNVRVLKNGQNKGQRQSLGDARVERQKRKYMTM
jgi:hypothetical protein